MRARTWSRRAIARELSVNRETVGRYLRLAAKPATEAPAGSESVKAPTGFSAGSRIQAARCEANILAKLDQGLSAQLIYQDLVAEELFAASYDSVKRFIWALERSQPLPFRRMECAPGVEVQVDFGQGAWAVVENGAEWLLDRARLVGLPHRCRALLSTL